MWEEDIRDNFQKRWLKEDLYTYIYIYNKYTHISNALAQVRLPLAVGQEMIQPSAYSILELGISIKVLLVYNSNVIPVTVIKIRNVWRR
jgi:hypothetical protein